MVRILKIILATLVVLCLVAVGAIYALSERRLAKTYDHAPVDFAVKTVLSPDEAERRARTFMCGGCHHDAGNILLDDPALGRIVAPNLTRVVPGYTDAELVRLIRHGIKRDGTGVVIMPASNLSNITDEDMADIIAWLRSLKPLPDAVQGGTSWGPVGRIGLALDQIPFEADDVAPARGGTWSVLVSGRADRLTEAEVAALPIRPVPWVEGDRNAYFAITPRTMTGRRLVAPDEQSG